MNTTTTAKAIIHRGDPRFCRFISLGGEHVAHLEPTADHNGHRLPYHAVLTDGTEAMFDTLAQVRVWVERNATTTLTTIETVKVGANALEPGMVICYNGNRHEAIVKVLDDFFYLTTLGDGSGVVTPEDIEFVRNRPESKYAEYLNTQRGEEYDVDASTIPAPAPGRWVWVTD